MKRKQNKLFPIKQQSLLIISHFFLLFRWSKSNAQNFRMKEPFCHSLSLTLSLTLSIPLYLDTYVRCMSVNTYWKWIIIHIDMNLYTLLINQFCQLDIIYLYVYHITKLHDNKCIHENSNQNRHTQKTTFFSFRFVSMAKHFSLRF